jgi:uncharacterized RDD family membrane protein YckC
VPRCKRRTDRARYTPPVRDVYAITTPENVRFEFELAGVASRATAWVIDLVVMGAALTASLVVVAALGVVFGGLAAAVYFVIAFVVQWGYGALTEWAWAGQTVGKRVVGIRVLQAAGTRITLIQAVVRNLVRVVDFLPAMYFSGGACALLDKSGRRLGDLAADTVVVRQRRSPRPSAVVAPTERYNSFIHDPAVIHASKRVTAPERDAMIGLSLRRDNLPIAVRYALFSKLARHLETRLGLQRPAYFSEERFVLNLTAVLLGWSDGDGRGGTQAPARPPGRPPRGPAPGP